MELTNLRCQYWNMLSIIMKVCLYAVIHRTDYFIYFLDFKREKWRKCLFYPCLQHPALHCSSCFFSARASPMIGTSISSSPINHSARRSSCRRSSPRRWPLRAWSCEGTWPRGAQRARQRWWWRRHPRSGRRRGKGPQCGDSRGGREEGKAMPAPHKAP